MVNKFAYDYRTRRIWRATNLETNLCVFDGGLSIMEFDASQSLTPHTTNLTVQYLRGPDLGGGVGGMVYSSHQDEHGTDILTMSHANHRGDVIARSSNGGALTWFALYEAYGTRYYEWGLNPDRQMANTKDEEAEIGLLNEGMRFRDLETGTFLTRDPIRYMDGPNMYCYVHCNPITHFDAFGLSDSETEEEDASEDDSMDGDSEAENTTAESTDESSTNVEPDEPESEPKAEDDKKIAEKLNSQKKNDNLSGSASDGKDDKKPWDDSGKYLNRYFSKRYPSLEDASRAASEHHHKRGEKTGKESGGVVFSVKDKDGNTVYGYTAIDGKVAAVRPNAMSQTVTAKGGTIHEVQHSHPDTPGYQNETISKPDDYDAVQTSQRFNDRSGRDATVVGVVVTPTRVVRYTSSERILSDQRHNY